MQSGRTIRIITSAMVIGILALLGLGFTQHGKVGWPSFKRLAPPGYYPVAYVSDGDTIGVRIASKVETVRFIGMDTPEVKDPRKPVQCFGQAASAETHKLLDGKMVRLEGDPTDSDRDKYHRLLRYVYLADGTLVNQYLTQHGYAFAYVIFPNRRLEQFRSWEAEARAQNRGLWASCQVHSDGKIEQTNAAAGAE